MNFEQLIINEDKIILEALELLSKIRDYSRLILFVTSKNGELLGSLTDGDVRRSLIKDKDLNKRVGEVCNKDFVYKYDSKNYLELNSIYKKDIKILPLLNKNKTISRFLDLDITKALIPVECVIMAGGRGKRLSPLTDNIPKPMIRIDNKPIIEHNIDRLIKFGIKKIHISVNYLAEQIESYFGDGSSKGIEIKYIYENKKLGTAGALSLIDNIETNNILLMNSDLFTNINFEKLFLRFTNDDLDMAISSKKYKVDLPYAVFETKESSIINLSEKPTYSYNTNAGVYMLKKEHIELIPKNKFYDITDLISVLIDKGKCISHVPINGYWIDIGSPDDLKYAQQLIQNLD
jgi:dTDP-glucose pyrophosphorylase